MALIALRSSFPQKTLLAAGILGCVFAFSPLVSAQHPGHVAAPPHVSPPVRVPAPPHAPAPRVTPPIPLRAPLIRPQPGLRPGFQPGPAFNHGHVFFRRPFFGFRDRIFLYPNWWLPCGSEWAWEYNCSGLPYFEPPPAPENYVQLPTYEYPQYFYSEEERALVRLYLKDGTVYSVLDYWFVSNELHFFLPDEEEEQVVALDELDLQKTIDVNTRRGFRVVMRNEPIQQYLRDHPNDTPPPLQPPPKN